MSASPRQSVLDRVLDHLRDGIRDGLFAPGQRLVEVDLTQSLDVSRGTIREALGRLAAEGLVEIIPHRGAAVRHMTEQDVAELFAVREILEGGAAGLAAKRAADSPHREALLAEIERQREWTEATDIPGYAESNEQVHTLLVEIADNALLADLIGQLHTKAWRRLQRQSLSVGSVRESSSQHVGILEAVAAGDADEAESLMRAHIGSTAQELPYSA